MSNGLKKVIGSAWFFPVLILGGFVLITRGKILTALGPIWRFLLPAALVYIVYRMVKTRVQARLGLFAQRFQAELQRQQQMQQTQRRGAAAGGGQPVIEICPKCGEPKASGRCRH